MEKYLISQLIDKRDRLTSVDVVLASLLVW